ncbi:MAG: protein kinase [Crocinitomix sp.]|nr:protein kinase [Crocinitomix sp.]
MKIKEVISQIHTSNYAIIEKVRLMDRSIVVRKTFNPANRDRIDIKELNRLRKRFIREVATQERLPHNLFIPVIYSNLESDNPWFLMPFAQRVYSQEIQLQKDTGGKIEGLADILNSLEYLHNLGLVHRDLKPQNVLLHEGQWKLADFGLITTDKDLTSTLTSTNSLAGTELYCAPDQVYNFKKVTHHADIYSFGAILHDIFNGEKRIPYSKLSAEGEIGFIIEKCTEEKIEKRFSDIASLRGPLLSFLSDKKSNSSADKTTKKWIDKLDEISTWKVIDMEKFLSFTHKGGANLDDVYYKFGPRKINDLFNIDQNTWGNLMLSYFDWICSGTYGFNYCDVLIGNIYKIYRLSEDLEIKSRALLSGAELGARHNRFYVMDYVLKMADRSIDDILAQRISIDIHVEGNEMKEHFIRCAAAINKSLNDYHVIISQEISK